MSQTIDASNSRQVVAPNFRLEERASGVLLHVTSLPGPHGNGDLGDQARRFVDFLADAGQRWWQMLPVNPVGPGHSPYSGVSAFAGNPLLVSLHELVNDGLLEASEVESELAAVHTDYANAFPLRNNALRLAYARFRDQTRHFGHEFAQFRERARFWLEDYTLFMALKQAHKGSPWTAWPREHAMRDESALELARTELADELSFYAFEQFVFDRQWQALRAFAQERGIGLIGDAPIFVAHDSSDVWANQQFFRLDAAGQSTVVSGVPPDYFSETGQRWGTPLYRWGALKRDGYRFWLERFRTLMERFDVIRLDHFIGFARYWSIPAESETAIAGRWVRGPGSDLFEVAQRELGVLPFIAEDLGAVTPKVRVLRKHFGMPGMRVLQFAFSGDPNNEFLPHRYPRRCVAYTGTHDNDTTVGWYEARCEQSNTRSPAQAEAERRAAHRYLSGPLVGEATLPIHWLMIRALFASTANTAIVPMQDLLGLGNEARMNTPGLGEGSWTWRLPQGALSKDLASTLRAFAEVYGRCCS